MPINPTKISDYLAKPSSIRSFVTKLDKSGAILPVVLLEAAVTGGRTYQAYKRDGYVEARERVTEESLGAVFWLFGAKIFGKMLDVAGKKFGKMPEQSCDVAQDEVRTSFKNFVAKMTEKMAPEKAEAFKNKIARFSVGKTFASLLTACLFIGLVVPKMNQAITKHMFAKKNAVKPEKDVETTAAPKAENVSINSVESFKSAENIPKKNTKQPSFKSAAGLTRIVQNFEENDIWKLMGTDVGTVTGRTANARNNDERVEVMFRDISSIYFYCFSTPAIINFLNKKDKFGGMNTKLNPMTAAEVHNELVSRMSVMNKTEMSVKEFREFALGSENYDKELYNKVFSKELKDAADKAAGKTKVNFYTTTLDEFKKNIDAHIKDTNKANSLKELASEMSTLQPLRGGQSILTETQVEDILRGGEIRKPSFMKTALNNIFKTKKCPDKLTNEFKYISQKDIVDRRGRILNYVESIIKNAENSKENVTWENMLKVNKRNLGKNGLYMLAGMGVSALFLSTIIPKIQYLITKIRTGQDKFPGVENLQQKTAEKPEEDKKVKA